MANRFIADLVAEVDIPVEGTLSRVVAKEGPLRVIVFAFDAGQELTEHTAAVPVILQALTGVLTVEAGGERHRLAVGSWLHLEAGEAHSVFAEEPSRLLLTMIRSGG